MNTKYEQWINQKLQQEKPLAKCEEWTEEMAAAFPELKRVRGHALLSSGYERAHWWLVTDGGEIIDPTASQFTDPQGLFNASIVHYEPWDESQEEPTGKCPNCGGYCYEGKYLCSDECAKSYEDYCKQPMKWW